MADPLQQLQDIVNQVPVEHTEIGTDEIMQLLNSSLEKGEPFASEFNKRVIIPLTDKINQKIYVTNIKVDGEQIGSYITDSLQKQTDDAIKSTSKDISKKLDSLPDSLNFKKDSNLDLKSMLGIGDKKSSLLTTHKWNKLQRDIIEKARKAVEQATFKLHIADSTKKVTGSGNHYITLKDFLGMDRAYSSPALTWKWHGLQYDIIKKAKEAVGKVDFALTSIDETVDGKTRKVHKITLKDFMGFDKTHKSIFATISWNNLQRKIISKAKEAVDNTTFELNELAPYSNTKTKKQVKQINLKDFLGINETSLWTKHRWNDLQRDIIKKAKKAIDDVKFELNEVEPRKWLFGKKIKKVDLSDFLNIKEEKPSLWTKHRWNDLQRTIIQKAKDAVGKTEFDFKQEADEKKQVQEPAETQTQKGQFKSLLDEEPIVKVGSFEKEAIKQLKGILGAEKVIPMKEKKTEEVTESKLPWWLKMLGYAGLGLIAGGLMTGISGLFDSGPFKGLKKIIARGAIKVGTVLTKFTGKFILDHFASLAKLMGRHLDDFAKIFGKEALHLVKPVSGLLKGIGVKLSKAGAKMFGKSAIKKIPLIGALFGLGFGISRFIAGDITGGLLEIASGVASIAPGPGTMISIAIDSFLAYRDIKGGGAKELGKKSTFSKNWREKLLPMIEKIPMINALIKLPKALGAFSTGDWKTGLKELAFILPGLEPLYNFFAEAKEEQKQNAAAGKVMSMRDIIQDMLTKKITKFYDSAPWWLQKIMKATMPDILKDAGEPVEPTEDQEKKWAKTQAIADAKAAKAENDAKPKANDFIWRAGQQSQPFDSKDNIISVKDKGVFEELIKYLKGDSKDKNAEKFIKEFTKASSNQQAQMSKEFKKLIDTIKEMFVQQQPQPAMSQVPSSQSNGTYADSNDIRDPAYILRARVWDRLRNGYVIV